MEITVGSSAVFDMFPTEELCRTGAWRGQKEMAAADCDCCRDERCQNGTRLQGALPDALQGSLKHLPHSHFFHLYINVRRSRD